MATKECPDCNGDGTVPCSGMCDTCGAACENEVDCDTCDGTGEVEDEDE